MGSWAGQVQRLAAGACVALCACGSDDGRGQRGRAADQDRGARRFADGRLSACRPARRFPAQLEQALKAKGLAVEIANAGVSGDTSSGGLARLDWSVPEGTDAVILELGANDMLRGVDPKVTREALDGDRPPAEGAQHRGAAVRDAGAAESRAGLCARRSTRSIRSWPRRTTSCSIRSFSTAIAADPKLNQRDGLHPTARGRRRDRDRHLAEGRGAAGAGPSQAGMR